MVLVLSQVELISCALCGSWFLSADQRLRKVVVVATSYSPQKVRLEDCGERQRTLNCPMWIWQSFVAGTGENLTFFTGKLPGSGGVGTKAGTRRGRPWKGGTAGVTGTAEITETKSDLSPTWITKNFSDSPSTL